MPLERRSIAVLDANVLFSAFVRDVLLTLAEAGLFVPRWSERIQQEWARNLTRLRPELTDSAARVHRAMAAAFPDALVTPRPDLEELFPGVQADDRHVAATALSGGATFIVTHNLRDFPAPALAPRGLAAVDPDTFAASLILAERRIALRALEEHRTGLRRPPLTAAEYRAYFVSNGLVRSAALLR
jgi:predicted nucleic acid-binding protein